MDLAFLISNGIVISLQICILVLIYKNFERLYDATIKILDIISKKNVLRK
jgi:hypothetical protein